MLDQLLQLERLVRRLRDRRDLERPGPGDLHLLCQQPGLELRDEHLPVPSQLLQQLGKLCFLRHGIDLGPELVDLRLH